MCSVGPVVDARRIARDGLARQRVAAGGTAVWWGAQGFQVPRYGSVAPSTAWASSGTAYGACVWPRDLVGIRIAEVYGHGGKGEEQVALQHVVGGTRKHGAVEQGAAGGTIDAGVRGVSKQDLQWLLGPCAMSAKSTLLFAHPDSIVYRVTDSPRRIHAVDYVINLSVFPYRRQAAVPSARRCSW